MARKKKTTTMRYKDRCRVQNITFDVEGKPLVLKARRGGIAECGGKRKTTPRQRRARCTFEKAAAMCSNIGNKYQRKSCFRQQAQKAQSKCR